jgi:nucleoside-diphosphate-sugar epimerase
MIKKQNDLISMKKQNKTILVVGSHGFIGGYVCNLLINAGWDVVGVDSINMYKPQNWQLFFKHFEVRQKNLMIGLKHFYRMDASSPVEISTVIKEHKPNVVLNLGGTAVADVCKQNIHEAVSSIYLLNATLLQALRSCDSLERYIYASSSMVFGDFPSFAPNEEYPKNPIDPYGAIKLGGEHLIQSFHNQFGLPYAVIRPSAVYGPLDSNGRVTGIFMKNAHLGQSLNVNDSLEQLDFTYVEDLAMGFFLACEKNEATNQVFNMTRGDARTIKDLAIEIKNHFPNIEIKYGAPAQHMEGLVRPNRGSLDISKARKILGFNPSTTLEKGIEIYAQKWREIFGAAGTPL